MPADRSLIERALRRDRWIVIVGLAAMTLLSWAYIMAGAGTGMSFWGMTSASLFPHRMAEMPIDSMPMEPSAWTPGYWIIMLLMWWIMMIAMMTPSAASMILLYGRATRHAQAGGRLQQGALPTAAFGGGYLLAWLGFSLIATLLMWALERTAFISAMTMSSTSAWLSAAILIFAGLYQLSPPKHVCLQRCRNPADFLSRHWRPGPSGALRMGLEHGLFCIGCCWALMALLFVGGIMNVLWIGILALFVILEKLAPHGSRFASLGGIVLLAWGATTLVAAFWPKG
jgi:predicted metal-binding membrane protein